LTRWLGTVPSQALGAVSCALLFLMMVLTFIDVAGRYLFASPLPAAYEIISLTMPGIIFCALPFVGLRESHVTIDLLDTVVPRDWKRWQSFATNLFCAAVMGFIAWRLGARAYDHFQFGDATDELYLPLWPFSASMAVLSAVATIAFLVNAYSYLVDARIPPAEEGASPV